MSIAKIDVAIAVLKTETEMPSGSAPRIAVVPAAVLTKRETERCQVAVHQECYGARDVNDLSSWACRACEESQVKRNCYLCPIKGGALKRTDVGDFWVHGTCTWFQPKMTFLDPDGMELDVGVLSVPLDSFKKKCVICEQVHGVRTKCCKCNSYYHAMCASRAGYHMKLHTYVSHGKQISRFDSYCPNHGDVNKSNALVLCTEEIVFSSMRAQRNNVRPSCSRLVKRDTENQSTSCPETDLAFSSSEEACARCHVYQTTNRKVTFYHGERIWCSVSDAREACYRAENEDCYFFRISEEFVLDATRKGTIARLINHSI
ncbi:histone-lysine N-methyltransferase ATX4-like isoform X3 [Carex rostrata]